MPLYQHVSNHFHSKCQGQALIIGDLGNLSSDWLVLTGAAIDPDVQNSLALTIKGLILSDLTPKDTFTVHSGA